MNKERDDINNEMIHLEKINNLIQKDKGLAEAERLFSKINELMLDAENTYLALCELEEEPPAIENLMDINTKVLSDYNMWKSISEVERMAHRFGMTKIVSINEGLEEGFDFLQFYEDWMTKVKIAKEFFSNSNNVDRLRVCGTVLETCEKLGSNYKILKILKNLEGEDLGQLMLRINKTENDDIASITDIIIKNHENEINDCLEIIKE